MQRRNHLEAALVSVVTAIGWACPAGADGESVRPRVGGAGIGAYAASGGPAAAGLSAAAAFYPGGRRLGLRIEARTAGGDGAFDRGLFTAGLVHEAAAARPRLSLALHGEVGALAPDPRAALGGGVEIQLWLVGPLALALGSSTHIVLDGLESELILAGSLGIRISR